MPMLMENDRHIHLEVRARSPGAFERFYRQTRDGVYGLLLAFTGQRDIADELFQETYARFLRQVHASDGSAPIRNLRAYLLRIARNLAADQARGPFPAESLQALEEDRMPIATPEESMEQDLEAHRALQLLRKLPENQREVILLRLYNDLGYREIAEMTGVPEKTLMSRYRYGIQKLRSLWNTGA